MRNPAQQSVAPIFGRGGFATRGRIGFFRPNNSATGVFRIVARFMHPPESWTLYRPPKGDSIPTGCDRGQGLVRGHLPWMGYQAFQPPDLAFGESRRPARRNIQGSAREWKAVACLHFRLYLERIAAALRAQPVEPAVADRDMLDLIHKDDVEDAGGFFVTRGEASRPRASSVRGTIAMRSSTSCDVRSAASHSESWASKSPYAWPSVP